MLSGSIAAAVLPAIGFCGRGGCGGVPHGRMLNADVRDSPDPIALPEVPSLDRDRPDAEPALDLSDEMRLLATARALLPEDPSEALRLCERHRQLFARGALREEREAFAIEALAALGRSLEAERRYVDFQSEFPQSTFCARLARALDSP